MIRRFLPTLAALLILLLVPLALFAPVALGQRTLLPVDALFLFEPYRVAADELGVGVAHNPLLADLILENYAWKQLVIRALGSGELPFWDPYIFAGHPFLANGQHSALYPLSIVFYVLPLWRAFGVFAWLQLTLAGWWAYLLARTFGVRRLGALVSGIVFQLCGCMIVSVVHPMIVAGASWLPFVLAMTERVIVQRPAWGGKPATLPWALLGAVGLGCQILAGHAENTYLVLLVMAAFALWRLLTHSAGAAPKTWLAWLAARRRAVTWLAIMVVLGLALGAVQLVPLYEVAQDTFRAGEAAATLAQVRAWGYPPRRLLTFAVPNFFGNPAHHNYFDLFRWQTVPATVNAYGDSISSHDWGIKNYVEGGAYLGLLPLLLAAIAVWEGTIRRSSFVVGQAANGKRQPSFVILFFALLSLFSLGCIFGTPLYALIYYLPFQSQSHSPFRWVFPLALSVALLAGFGIQFIARRTSSAQRPSSPVLRPLSFFHHLQSRICNLLLLGSPPSLVTILAALAFWTGLGTLGGLLLSRLLFSRLEPLVERLFWSLALAANAFPDHRAFYSYEFKWLALLALLLTASGIVLRVSRCPLDLRGRPVWQFLAVGVLVVDLVAFGLGFNPAVDPALLDYVPPVVEFLRQDTSVWRYATFTPPGTTKTMNANVGMFYNWQTVNGYDSIFSRQYSNYMGWIEEQDELPYNRIASFSDWSSLDSPLTDLLNVKYIITEVEIPNPAKYRLVYQDEAVRVYENLAVLPRAFTMPASAAVVTADVHQALRSYDVHQHVILETGSAPAGGIPQPSYPTAQTITHYGLNDVVVDVSVPEASWLVLTDSFFPGWKAFVRPQGAEEQAEQEVEIARVAGNFRGVLLGGGSWTVRFRYSPDSVKVGAFVSFIAGMTVLFLVGLYLWRFFYREEDDASTVRRVAKNSLAPIVLNLLNRGVIDMAFAALMARILGPVGNGRYATAANVYLLFDVLANFGLDVYLMREVARDRERTWTLFLNSTVLRLLLFVSAIPLLAGFLGGWQALGSPLTADTVWTALLLYLGLLPGSVAYGLAALFRGCEKHEIPAAIQTVTTITKVTLGVLVLTGGWGIMGLGVSAIVTNTVTLVVLAVLARRMIWPTVRVERGTLAWPLQRAMLVESWPLMASILLQSLFPSVNVLLLQRLQTDAAVGWYDAGRKWVDALNIVPSFFTLAVFPVMSRQAAQDRSGLQRSYHLSVKLLTMLALPAAVLTTIAAPTLVGLLSGASFLPYGAQVLQLLIWSIAFGWLNSLSNYVLIALNRQRYVLLVSAARVVFAVVANLATVGTWSYLASALVIGGGELLLALLFAVDLHRHLGRVDWLGTVGRPALAALAMAAVAAALALFSRPLAFVVSVPVYGLALWALRVLTAEEQRWLAPIVPAALRRMVQKRSQPESQ